ncbi:MAG: type transport system permease protein [Methanolobus sp.]|nr:type transport system permease protein [Methanolobus sp.]
MRVLIVLWNDFINEIRISEIKYDSSRKGKRIVIYMGVIFLCMLFLGGAYIEAKILVDNTEYGALLDLIIKAILIIFLIISNLFSVRYVLYSEANISRIAPLPLSTMEIMNVRTLETVLKNVLLSLIVCISFSIVIFDSAVDIIAFLICCVLIIPISTYNIAHAAFVLFSRSGAVKAGTRVLSIVVLLINAVELYEVLMNESLNIGILLAIMTGLIVTHWLLTVLINRQFFAIVESNQKKSRVYKLETDSYDLGQALFYKELKMYLSDKLFIVNSSFGAFMLLVVAVLVIVLPFNDLFKDSGVKAGYVYNSIPVIFSLIISTCCTTYCSFSLEGKNMWIYQKAPVTVMQIVKAKVEVNLMISVPAIIISSCIGIVKTAKLSPIVPVMSFILPIIVSMFVSLFGCLIDMLMCNLEWENAQVLIKQTKTYPITLLAGMYLTGLSEAGVILLLPRIGINAVYCIILAVYLLALGGVLLGLKNKSGKFSYGVK